MELKTFIEYILVPKTISLIVSFKSHQDITNLVLLKKKTNVFENWLIYWKDEISFSQYKSPQPRVCDKTRQDIHHMSNYSCLRTSSVIFCASSQLLSVWCLYGSYSCLLPHLWYLQLSVTTSVVVTAVYYQAGTNKC